MDASRTHTRLRRAVALGVILALAATAIALGNAFLARAWAPESAGAAADALPADETDIPAALVGPAQVDGATIGECMVDRYNTTKPAKETALN